MTAPELKPCPFCGGEAKTECRPTRGWTIMCSERFGKCQINARTNHFAHSKDAAIAAWNTRSDLATKAVKVKALVWDRHPAGLVASTGLGSSYIIDDRNFRPKFLKWPSGNFAPDVGSVVEAKAAAQADLQARVLSALEQDT